MSRKKSRSPQSRPSDRSHPGKPESRNAKDRSGPPAKHQHADNRTVTSAAMWRETIESIVIAFVLAFLFRTFEAEAFVIPTGSMAPTLMGRHKDLLCEKCGYPFRVSASDEVDPRTNRRNDSLVVGCTCPMCRYTMDVSNDRTYRSYKGDRILVGKFPYQYRDPKRWEVTVFKYPGGAKTNFIKRIVGLPNETLRIRHGDILTMRQGENEFSIEQKPPDKARAMLQVVYDNDYARGIDDSLGELLDQGWPARWSGLSLGENPGGWETTDHVSFQADGAAGYTAWLEYRHIVPSRGDWDYLAQGLLPPGEHKPRLITDFCGYNTDIVGLVNDRRGPDRPRPEPLADKMGLHWVGDLALECQVEIGGNTGQVLFDLVEGGKHFLCTIDVATGTATLEIPGCPEFGTLTAADVISGPGKYRFMFANLDDMLRLWVGRRVVEFNGDGDYSLLGLDTTKPQKDDLGPVKIGSRGVALHVSHLKVYRDIYYIAAEGSSRGTIADFSYYDWPYIPMTVEEVAGVLSDPERWGHFGTYRPPVDFVLEDGQFLALGDNSAESKDGRLWGCEGYEHYVERDLLIGKAIWIYWPHSLDKIPGTKIPIRLFPNFWRMWFVK
jgi:signal peptidase I